MTSPSVEPKDKARKPLRRWQAKDPLRDASSVPDLWKLRLQTTFGVWAKRPEQMAGQRHGRGERSERVHPGPSPAP